jgi:hypothetical protein
VSSPPHEGEGVLTSTHSSSAAAAPVPPAGEADTMPIALNSSFHSLSMESLLSQHVVRSCAVTSSGSAVALPPIGGAITPPPSLFRSNSVLKGTLSPLDGVGSTPSYTRLKPYLATLRGSQTRCLQHSAAIATPNFFLSIALQWCWLLLRRKLDEILLCLQIVTPEGTPRSPVLGYRVYRPRYLTQFSHWPPQVLVV